MSNIMIPPQFDSSEVSHFSKMFLGVLVFFLICAGLNHKSPFFTYAVEYFYPVAVAGLAVPIFFSIFYLLILSKRLFLFSLRKVVLAHPLLSRNLLVYVIAIFLSLVFSITLTAKIFTLDGRGLSSIGLAILIVLCVFELFMRASRKTFISDYVYFWPINFSIFLFAFIFLLISIAASIIPNTDPFIPVEFSSMEGKIIYEMYYLSVGYGNFVDIVIENLEDYPAFFQIISLFIIFFNEIVSVLGVVYFFIFFSIPFPEVKRSFLKISDQDTSMSASHLREANYSVYRILISSVMITGLLYAGIYAGDKVFKSYDRLPSLFISEMIKEKNEFDAASDGQRAELAKSKMCEQFKPHNFQMKDRIAWEAFCLGEWMITKNEMCDTFNVNNLFGADQAAWQGMCSNQWNFSRSDLCGFFDDQNLSEREQIAVNAVCDYNWKLNRRDTCLLIRDAEIPLQYKAGRAIFCRKHKE